MVLDFPPSTPIRVIGLAKSYAVLAVRRYKSLHLYSKLLIWFLGFFYIALTAVIIYLTPQRIAQYLYDKAHAISLHPLGWLALGGTMVIVSFPPMIGHTTLATICGFAYGMKGFFIASTASLVGSAVVFVVLRLLFRQRIRKWASSSEKWQALESVIVSLLSYMLLQFPLIKHRAQHIRSKGLPLIILIRISPLPPWVYSNTLFSSIEAVKFWQFCVATLFTFPKICLHVFIGSRAAGLADGDQRGHMDTQTKAINTALIIGGTLFTIFISWFVYRSVQSHIRHLEGIPPQVDELAAEALEDYDEEAPLLTALSPRHSAEEQQH